MSLSVDYFVCLIDLYRKMTEQFRPELFDDSEVKRDRLYK
jgi:hypothetical protein